MSAHPLSHVERSFNVRLRYGLLREARLSHENLFNACPSRDDLVKLSREGVDVYSFPVRTFLGERLSLPNYEEVHVWMDNVALLRLDGFDAWWSRVGKKTRNMVRKSERQGVVVSVVREYSDEVAEGLWRIYNETPIRQGRWFRGYGTPKESFKQWRPPNPREAEVLGAFWRGQLIGFLTLAYGDRVAMISQILSMVAHFDKAVNNALVAAAVRRCCERGMGFLIYARMGNHPSLDKFKESNGFSRYPLPRLFVPLTRRGKVFIKLRLHVEPQDLAPRTLKGLLIPMYNALSRKLRF